MYMYNDVSLILQHAWVQSVLAMIRHFQLLFDVPHLEGVYTAMSQLYQQTEHSKNVLKRLKASLKLGMFVEVESSKSEGGRER